MKLSRSTSLVSALTVLVMILFALTERLMGREFLSDSGFGIYTGAWTSNTSQWLLDPYSSSHVLHGILFFWILLLFRKRLTLEWRFFVAVVLEIGWELLENSPIIINRYRAATASLDYFGDSILNSVSDVLCVMFGFWIASKLPWKWTLTLLIAIELILLVTIRDNLTLNILMLIAPIDAIKTWQASGH